MRLRGRLQSAKDWVRFGLLARLDRRALIAAAVVLGIAVIALIVAIDPFGDEEDGGTGVVTITTEDTREAPVGTLGFPLVATRNTTRISGPDPIADAAAAALASHPPAPDAQPLEAATLVPEDGWQAGIAASVLAGPPLRAPVLVSGEDEVPASTADALSQLNPRGGGPDDVAVYAAGGAAVPGGLKTEEIQGDSPAELANSVDRLRQELVGREPEHIVIASSDQPGYAMPAAAWAARSGDPVLFSGRNQVPPPTIAALRRHAAAAIYILGPESVISRAAERAIARVSATVSRVGAEGIVQNALLFARYSDGSFGWDIDETPGHGMELANAGRPLDAAAAASLASSGKWGPLLLTESADTLPPELRSFLLDIKPGYVTDPTQAVYNHVWLMGDASAIGGQVQAEIDELAELAQIGEPEGITEPEVTPPGTSGGTPPKRGKDDRG